MPFGYAAAAVAVGSSLISASASSKAADQQTKAAREGMAQEERMFERGLEETAPFREAGIGQLESYQQLLTPQGRGEALSAYYGGEEFKGFEQQAEQSILRNQAATGGLRSGGTQAALAGIAPQLGQNYLNQQAQNQLALINVGQGLAGQASQQANVLGGSQAAALGNIGSYQAGGTLAKADAINTGLGGLFGGLSGAGGFGGSGGLK